jgi:glycosyltransferase involved in cell wall biosynthesis
VARLGLDAEVRLAPAATREQLADSYRRADVFALTPFVTGDGDRDGIPNVLVEALASGLPAVSTTVGGIPELVAHGRNGLLAAPRDVGGIASHLADLLDDPARRARLGAAGRSTVEERFDARQAAAALAPLLGQPEAVTC